MKVHRSPCQSFHTVRTSQGNFTTPERLVKVQANSGVKCSPFQKNENQFKNYQSSTISKRKDSTTIYDYINELEQKINKLEQSQTRSLNNNYPEILQLEKRMLMLLNENCELKSEALANQKLAYENEQLKQLVQEQQMKILEFGEQYNLLFDSHQKVCEEYRVLESKIQTYELTMSIRKHSSFSEYFKTSE
ncbi:unnamed protein product (macronuclear) [Paramecium tetraurelia]|uniref:Uncharacterized protein n=1 Tax=Paramecium tetraurelia TaxID=5888 RepID=A0BYY4_PARTE|nr:uncharacterized protein GSPATT00033604001 [Paramecium tetraurelia]CAK63751.1 unnamed protein product [Paramecium tetraurelia]|eukprot:XP_001431149.1 hypothetical protein (macronuclear) [Paramecium tetraurelia strain d4-2]